MTLIHGSLVDMKRSHLAISLAIFYFALSFNAYACLLPLYGDVEVAQGSECAMPKEPPVRDACDAFKTIGVQTMSPVQPLPVSLIQWNASATVSFPTVQSVIALHSDHSSGPPFHGRDPLSLTSILRI